MAKWRRCARGAAGTLALGAVLALAACAAEPPALPAGVTVTLQQLRSDVPDRTAQVRVVNASDEDLRIARVELRDDWFAGAVVRERESTVPAGRTVDLRITLPPSACEGEPDAADRRSTLVIATREGAKFRVAADDPLRFVAGLHARECLAHDVAAVTALSWGGFTPSPPGSPATLRLDIAPAGGAQPLRIVEVRPTNLLQFGAESTDPFPVALAVDGTGEAASVDVPLMPLRCDAHAVQEDKRGTVFTLAVETASGEGLIEVPADEEERGRILSWVADWCGFG
ncbi:hypothetical protein [Microbacterium sp. zg.Y909]|uniref:hypothetical protein n=1 Tax=Microbacterium sp. zg.Y909 TaxID=2969413 RepID=UPI00214D0021|nr:hypothetical protein [Microbacterium sp. zg.Y909]MCR2826120.1 hypothetical protein [Microbacterium sp. zg.Y909]